MPDETEPRQPPVDPRLWRYAAASRSFFVVIALLSLLQTAVIVGFAFFTTRAIVDAIAGADLAGTLLALAGIVVARSVLALIRERVAARASARVESQLRAAVLDGVAQLGPEWTASRSTSHLALVAGRGLDALEPYVGRYLPQLVQTVIATPILVAAMWSADAISGLTVLLTLPLIPIFMILIGLATRSVQRRQWETLTRLATRFSETVQGLSTLTVFGRQRRAADAIERVTDDYRRETMTVLRVSFLSGFALEFLASISVAIVAVAIGFRLIDGSLTLSVGLFVLLLAPEAFLPLRQVGVQFHAASEGVAATRDVFAVLDDAAAASADIAPAPAPTGTDHVLRVRDVRVRDLPPVTLDARSGEIVLIEGPSGAGKSSLLHALLGFAPATGRIEFDGVAASSLAPSAWLGWAGQRAGLAAGTVAENIRLGDDDMPERTVREALALVGLGALDPARMLGVQGAGLSGGQAQRVAVARALARHLRGHAPVLALDEPSAALDADAEAHLWRSLRQVADAGALIVLVSHRESARGIADRVVRLSGAEVTA
ncbi:thiol reductant ABC exporter subunit CydD [Microbacterium aquilitoris]|uniref:Thiol reductant ABC exporter subunit CydD n=1 Tax=Microbacterium aquilitoris TaxID=3067307 RepID=A0ABU3GHF2_9MICO|nr:MULTISPECIES: thiol reductant ABC exporter subunit CydD [unclassified Microbacterium]MDT3330123.1 thiol reductant ABC exporter subunit CydD [Microbacterium sp. KSW-18]MDT3345956.1 thiol reductant ABC exporter subunit CydD [Microbacterium sp. KSW2-22]